MDDQDLSETAALSPTAAVPTMQPSTVDALLADEEIPLAHRTLWSGLWDGEVLVRDWLSVQVEDVDLAAGVLVRDPVKPREQRRVAMSERTGALMRELAQGRSSGALFVSDGGRVTLEAALQMAQRRAGVRLHAFRAGGVEERVAGPSTARV